MVIRQFMFKHLFQSTFSQIFLGVTATSILALLIAWGANYIRVMDAFTRFASRQVVVFQGGEDVYVAEKLKLPPEFQQAFDAYKHTVEQQFVVTLGIGMALSLVAGAFISLKITQPLSQLNQTINSVTASGYTIRAPQKGSLEMRALISSFNRLIAELEEQETARQDLFTDISHELNTPLTKIRGQIEGMLDGVYPQDAATLTKIMGNLAQLEFLIEALDQANRLTPQDVKLQLQKVKVKPLIESSVSGLRGKPIEFKLNLDPKLTLKADPHRLKQIIDNLVSNAYKYTPSGTISVTAAKNRLVVGDTGIGISPEDLPHVFDRLYRAEKSRNRLSGGLGLGLFITKKLVDLHGWSISVQSAPHQGSTFTVIWG